MVEVRRKKNETFDAMLRRMQRRFQESGRHQETKRRRFSSRDMNKTKRQEAALRRVRMTARYQYLLKTGQLPEDTKKRTQRRPN